MREKSLKPHSTQHWRHEFLWTVKMHHHYLLNHSLSLCCLFNVACVACVTYVFFIFPSKTPFNKEVRKACTCHPPYREWMMTLLKDHNNHGTAVSQQGVSWWQSSSRAKTQNSTLTPSQRASGHINYHPCDSNEMSNHVASLTLPLHNPPHHLSHFEPLSVIDCD